MDFKNTIELDLDIQWEKTEHNKYEVIPKLTMNIYCKENEDWELKKTLQFYNVIDLENLNQIYLDEIEKLQQPPQLPPQSDYIDPDDIPF